MLNSIKESLQSIVKPAPVHDATSNQDVNDLDKIGREARKLVQSYIDNGFALEGIYTYRSLEG